jgi:hypothetical protein
MAIRRMAKDGGLPLLFRKRIACDWQTIETWSTGQGVPDLNYCLEGVEGWIEAKQTSGWAVAITPEQVGWAERRLRHGGRVLLAVRRKTEEGPRKGAAADELWLFRGSLMREVKDNGIKNNMDKAMAYWLNGPENWDWNRVRYLMKNHGTTGAL